MQNSSACQISLMKKAGSRRSLSVSCLLTSLLALAIACLSPAIAALECEESGYCSLGKVTPFMGAIHTAKGFQAALDARSYKKEVICSASLVNRMANTFTSFKSLEALGIGHHMVLMNNMDSCLHTVAHMPKMGCVWYDTLAQREPRGKLYTLETLFLMRYHLVVRAIQLGYNIFMVDNDVIFMHDPYRVWKAPPFNNVTVISASEGGGWSINSGATYVQNAKPSGPAVWLFATLVDRGLRMGEGVYQWRDSEGFRTKSVQEQYIFNDMMKSVISGRIAPMLSDQVQPGEWKVKVEEYEKREIMPYMKTIETIVELPAVAWLGGRNPNNFMHRWAPLKVPHLGYGHPPEELKLWPIFPVGRGNISEEWWKILVDDCPSCPPVPDHTNPSDIEKLKAIPPESIAWHPAWFMDRWCTGGRYGRWDNRTTNLTHSLMGHVHVGLTECGDQHLAKLMVVCITGWCDFDMFRQLSPRHQYYSSTHGDSPTHDHRPHNVVALSPEVDLSGLRNPVEAWWIFYGLAQVAYAMNRTVAWPDIPCNATFISRTPTGTSSVPLDIGTGYAPHGPLPSKCSWDLWWLLGCMENGRGLYTAELTHFASRLTREQQGVKANTIFQPTQPILDRLQQQIKDMTQASLQLNASRPTNVTSAADLLVQVDAAQLTTIAAELVSVPLVYLGHPIRLKFQAETAPPSNQKPGDLSPVSIEGFNRHWLKCTALNRTWANTTCPTMYRTAVPKDLHEQIMEAGVRREMRNQLPTLMLV